MAFSCVCGFKSNLKFSVERHKQSCPKALNGSQAASIASGATTPLLSAVDGQFGSIKEEDVSAGWRRKLERSVPNSVDSDLEKALGSPLSQVTVESVRGLNFSAARQQETAEYTPGRRPFGNLRQDSSPARRMVQSTVDLERGRSPVRRINPSSSEPNLPSQSQAEKAANNSGDAVKEVESAPAIATTISPRPPALDKPFKDLWGDQNEVAVIYDIVQFNAPEFFVTEGENKMSLTLMRIGKLEQEAIVDWATVDVTAKAGMKYTAASGKINFAPHQDHAEIEVEILDNDLWETTKEFKVVLAKPVNCTLGRYLFETRVIIIDDDTFPSNSYKEDLMDGEEGIERVPNRILMWGFLKHCVQTLPGVGRRCVLIVILDQMHNVYYLLRTYLVSIYMVDTVFAKEPEGTLWMGTRENTAVLVALLLGVPLIFTHLWDYHKVQLNLTGDLCTYVQTALFTRYFNYTDKARRRTPTAEIQYAINKEALELVENGFMKCFDVVNMFGKLCIFVAFVLRENPSALWVTILYPVCVLGWLWMRINVLVETSEDVVQGENQVADKVQLACAQYRLVSDYGKRPQMAKELSLKIMEMNQNCLRREAVKVNSEKFTQWMSTALITIYIITNSQHVFDHKLSLGIFLAMVKLFGELGESFEKAFSLLMDFFSAIGPLQKVTRFLNSAVDLNDSLTRTRTELTESLKLRRQIREADPTMSSQACVDNLPILIDANMSFNFAQFEGGAKEDAAWVLVAKDKITIEQGRLTSIFGTHSCGKATMIKVLSGFVFPTSGHICVPSHLRRLHVAANPVLLETGLWGNLVFGLDMSSAERKRTKSGEKSEDKVEQRSSASSITTISSTVDIEHQVLSLLHRFQNTPFADLELRLKAELEDESLREGEKAAAWRDTLTSAHSALIGVLRGLVMNPELMVVDRPLVHFAGSTQHAIMRLFKEHIADKGWMSTHAMELRRPRSVIFSTDYQWAADNADVKIELRLNKEGNQNVSSIFVTKKKN